MKNNFFKVFGSQFWILVGALLMVTAIAFGMQSLLFRTDTMPSLAEISIGDITFGKMLNMAVFVVILAFAGWLIIKDTAADRKTMKTLFWDVLLSFLATVFMYISIIAACPWWVMGLCFVAIISCKYMQHRQEIDTDRVYIAIAVSLAYCVGAYFAMILNEITPTIDVFGASILALTTLTVWFWPSQE